ncbi:MAG: MurR/RpiR family transcriptional regulator [Desulfosarcinaceae bacterium]
MAEQHSHPVIQDILKRLDSLTPKGRLLGQFIIQNPRKAVFMTTKELSESCQVSEATVVRFVSQLGYGSYGDFLQALRDFVDTGLSLPERVDLPGVTGTENGRLHRVLLEEIDNLRQLYERIDADALSRILDLLQNGSAIYVTGSRISYTFAYYLAWSLTKVRKGVHLLKGSDSSAIDWLTNAPENSVLVMFAISRYPNELIRLGKVARRLDHTLVVVTDSSLCPILPFAHHSLIYLVLELAMRSDARMKEHQGRLEQIYRENDVLFDMYTEDFGTR